MMTSSVRFQRLDPAWAVRRGCVAMICASALFGASPPALAQAQRPDPSQALAAQRDALRVLDRMDGLWRGPAWTLLPGGGRHELIQTERVGPLLGGAIKLIEGRGFEADGSTGFNAFAVLSFDQRQQRYTMQSHAQGQAGTFVVSPTADGFVWTIPIGADGSIRYTAVIRDGVWFEVGDRLAAGQPPQRIFEMRLKRLGDSPWPGDGAVPLR